MGVVGVPRRGELSTPHIARQADDVDGLFLACFPTQSARCDAPTRSFLRGTIVVRGVQPRPAWAGFWLFVPWPIRSLAPPSIVDCGLLADICPDVCPFAWPGIHES